MIKEKTFSIKGLGLSSFSLHILAMVIMLIDHMWGTVIRGNMWMTNLGRLAFPMFAFMLVEGFFHTSNIKKYILRVFIWAVISEIPYNLMMGGYWIDPFEQNVMWTFLIALFCMYFAKKIMGDFPEQIKEGKRKIAGAIVKLVLSVLVFFFGSFVAMITFVDYGHYGILMVAVFFFFRGNSLLMRLLQLAGMILVNIILFKGMIIDISILGRTFSWVQQGFAVFSLIPIWLYKGKKGPGGKIFKWICYGFYPAHILILSIIGLYL